MAERLSQQIANLGPYGAQGFESLFFLGGKDTESITWS